MKKEMNSKCQQRTFSFTFVMMKIIGKRHSFSPRAPPFCTVTFLFFWRKNLFHSSIKSSLIALNVQFNKHEDTTMMMMMMKLKESPKISFLKKANILNFSMNDTRRNDWRKGQKKEEKKLLDAELVPFA